MIKVWRAPEIWGRPPRRWLLRGMLAAGDICTLYGDSGIGKSYFGLTVAGVLASGANWDNRVIATGPVKVAYLPTEGHIDDVEERLATIRANEWPVDDNLLVVEIAPLNLQKHRQASVKDELLPFLQENEIDVLFVDSLYSSLSGSLSDDNTIQEYMGTIKVMQAEMEKESGDTLTVVQVHHNHRARRNTDGNLIDEGGDSFHGSGFIRAMSSQMWLYKAPDKRGGSPKFIHTKGRSRFTEVEDFYVLLDKETGVLTTSAVGIDTKEFNFRKWAAKKGEFRRQEAFEAYKLAEGVTESMIDGWIGDMMRAGALGQLSQGRYKWTQPKSTQDPRRGV